MKGILTVMAFTFREQVRKKSFIVSTVIVILLSAVVICLPAIISSVKGTGTGAGKGSAPTHGSAGTVMIVDSENVLGGNLSELQNAFPTYQFELKKPTDENAPGDEKSLENSVKTNSKNFLVVLSLVKDAPSFDYYVQNMGNGPDPGALSTAIQKTYSDSLLTQSNVSPDVIQKVDAVVSYSYNQLGRGTPSGMVASYAVIFLLFFSIYFYGYWVAMSIASEKTSRVMEVLITSTKPSRIVLGKSIGMGLLGLCQLVAVIAVDAAVYFVAFPGNFTVGGTPINLSNFSPFAILMIVIYFIFGFSLFAMMDAVTGATVSKAEDVQQAMMPVSMIGLFSFYFSYSTILAPNSTAAAVASLIPFTAPFAMPSRLLNASVPAWQIAASLVLLAATATLMAYISIKLYSSAVLHYGKRLKISELVRMSKSR